MVAFTHHHNQRRDLVLAVSSCMDLNGTVAAARMVVIASLKKCQQSCYTHTCCNHKPV